MAFVKLNLFHEGAIADDVGPLFGVLLLLGLLRQRPVLELLVNERLGALERAHVDDRIALFNCRLDRRRVRLTFLEVVGILGILDAAYDVRVTV